jgi:hypothetical protein
MMPGFRVALNQKYGPFTPTVDEVMMAGTAKTRAASSARWISRREADAIVDAHAQRVLGVSGKVFISNWKAGKYRKLDSDACPGVIELALLAPLPRRARGRKNTKGSRR